MHTPEPTPIVVPTEPEPGDDAPLLEPEPPAVDDPPDPRRLPPVTEPGRHPPAQAIR